MRATPMGGGNPFPLSDTLPDLPGCLGSGTGSWLAPSLSQALDAFLSPGNPSLAVAAADMVERATTALAPDSQVLEGHRLTLCYNSGEHHSRIPIKLAKCPCRGSTTVFLNIRGHLKDGQALDAENLFPGSYRAVNVRN